MTTIPITCWFLRRLVSERSGKTRANLLGYRGNTFIESGTIASVDGAVITTLSGSRYELTGPPAHNFAGLVEPIDPAAPLANLAPAFTFEPHSGGAW